MGIMEFYSEAKCNPDVNPELSELCKKLQVHHPAAIMYPRYIHGILVETDQVRAEAGKALCRSCPVRKDCLLYAVETNEVFGTWGGYTEKERRDKEHVKEL